MSSATLWRNSARSREEASSSLRCSEDARACANWRANRAVRPPALTAFERARLLEYAACFEARDFDAVRDMLADDVRLDLVNRLQRQGRSEVGEYFHRYAQSVDWRVVAKGDSPELTRRGGTSRRG